jgi:hypothetical protein
VIFNAQQPIIGLEVIEVCQELRCFSLEKTEPSVIAFRGEDRRFPVVVKIFRVAREAGHICGHYFLYLYVV